MVNHAKTINKRCLLVSIVNYLLQGRDSMVFICQCNWGKNRSRLLYGDFKTGGLSIHPYPIDYGPGDQQTILSTCSTVVVPMDLKLQY